jgi:hypothetical protein
VRTLGFVAASLQPPPAPPAPPTPPLISVSLSLQPPLVLPQLPSGAAPPVVPPVPPAPPAPPGGEQALPIELSVTTAGIAVPPTPGVTAQPTPPVQPSPPAGARREAKQRQAAAAKSEQTGVREGIDVDRADAPNVPEAASMTRRPPDRPLAFTAPRRAAQPSAWARDALIGGGLGIAALVLAAGAMTIPVRRTPRVPAPARARGRRW